MVHPDLAALLHSIINRVPWHTESDKTAAVTLLQDMVSTTPLPEATPESDPE